jgi:hypothetical protein
MEFIILTVMLFVAVIVLAICFHSANELANMRMEIIEDDLIHIIDFCKEHITNDCKAQNDSKTGAEGEEK